MSNKNGCGDKYSASGSHSQENLGLIEQDGFSTTMKLRGETNHSSPRPTSTTKSMKTDRGTFKNKC